jgi:transmembrane sensor
VDNRIKDLFERYQSGHASNEERTLVEEWFDSYENGQQKNISLENRASLFEQMDSEIYHMLRGHQGKHWLTNYWLQAVAVVLICFCAALFATLRNSRKPDTAVNYTLISAPKGVKKQCELADGTIVYLNSGSEIRVPSNFNAKDRQVILTGEAFFTVKHDPSRPFKIHSGKLVIADIGTSFNVKAYQDEGKIKVAVESGVVSVAEGTFNNKLKMFAGAMTHNQQLVYDKKSQGHTLNNIQTSEITAWKENKLRFEDASFEEIANTLERWYGVTIKLNNNTGNFRHYTIGFNNEPVSKVLKVLQTLSGMTYEINNKSISINLKTVKKP